MFCTSCGKEIDDSSIFCEFCGAKQTPIAPLAHGGVAGKKANESTEEKASIKEVPEKAAETVKPVSASASSASKKVAAEKTAAVPAKPVTSPAKAARTERKPMSKGTKALLITVVVLVAAFFGTKAITAQMFSPEKSIDKFIESIRQRDESAFRAITSIRGGQFELTSEAIKPFFDAYSDDRDALSQMRSVLNSDAERLSAGESAEGDDFLRLIKSSHYIYSTYQVELAPLSVKLKSEFDNTEIMLGETSYSAGKSPISVTLLPGTYSIKASCNFPETDMTLDAEQTLPINRVAYGQSGAGSSSSSESGAVSFDAGSMEINISFVYASVFLQGDNEFTFTSMDIDGKPYAVDDVDFHRGITISPVAVGSTVTVKATADGKSCEETRSCSAGTNSIRMAYVPPAADSPDYLWNNAAAAVASADLLGSTLRDASNNGWTKEWLTFYYYGTSDLSSNPKAVSERTKGISLNDWLNQYVTYSGANDAGWGDIWLSLMGVNTSYNASYGYGNSGLQERFLYYINYCDSMYFSRSDLSGFDANMAILARNAPYAHAGRMFDTEVIRSFFQQFDWYHPIIQPNAFKENMLNSYETANKNLVVAYEKEMGYK